MFEVLKLFYFITKEALRFRRNDFDWIELNLIESMEQSIFRVRNLVVHLQFRIRSECELG